MMFGLGTLASGALGFLGKVPVWAWFLAAALVWGWLGNREAATLKRGWAEERAANAVETGRIEALHRGEERRREIEKEGVVNEINKRLEQARALGTSESVTVGRLQRDIANLKAGRSVSGNSAPLSPGEATDRIAGVADECVERFGALVVLARKASIAGTGCEAQYKSLTPGR